ncbi:mechanosensitive ion channel family protein [Symmachiella macrocystis]|uniref:mechanosensitive ion channel family protein n=1 Tax=Symmachiella macrocystis TaxID=2527985 RepID=UPI0018D3B4AB|nr:mechanosensitive ion channel domain-containing protein [Symmachiella macrocystis]
MADTEKTAADFNTKVLPASERIMDCLDLSALPGELRDTAGIESAVYLKEVLDRVKLPEEDDIPGATTADGKPLSRWRIPGTRLSIVRVQDGSQEGAYLFSPEMVRQAAKIYRAAEQLPYRKDGPKVSPRFYDRYVALTKRQPTLTADTSSPRGTLTLFLDTINQISEMIRAEKHIDRTDPKFLPLVTQVYRCLDLSEIPEYSRDYYAGEAAVCLKEILDRVTVPPPEEIPGPENLQAMEGGEPLVRWQVPNTKITIARVAEGPQRGEYLFTVGTVQRAAEMYEEVKSQPYRTKGRPVSVGFHDWYLSVPANPTVADWVDWLPDGFRHRTLGLAIWQWIGLLLAMIVGLGIMFTIYWVGGIRSESMRQRGLLRYWITTLFAIVAMFVPLVFKHVIWEYLSIRGTALYVAQFSADIVFLMALIAVILAVSSRLADSVVALPKVRSRQLDATLVRILFRVLGIIAAAIVFLEGGRYLGFPLTTLLASAGIGGLAIALSAQGMVKGLFGTVTLLLDRPFRVGDRIVANGHDGVVEEIGLRSTKIRSFLSNHLISIPNDQMAESEIENVGKRKHISRISDLHIPIDTPREKVDQAVTSIRAILDNHEGMDPEYPPRVYFNEFNPDSFNIRILYWYTPPDLWNYYAFCEKVNLQIFKVFDQHGIQFSLPLRHSYWKHDDEQGPLEVTFLGNGVDVKTGVDVTADTSDQASPGPG